MIKSPINHQSPPSTPTTMSLLLNPLSHPASILFKTTLKQKPQLHSITISTPAIRKHRCIASPICFSFSSFSGVGAGEREKLRAKMAFVDTVYGTNFGFQASTEKRAKALELIVQLEAVNPTPAPTETPELLDGNWILVYTAFSELLPLLAAGNLPLENVEKICQSIDSNSHTIENSTTISSPVAPLSYSASAAFEVRSPARIQVQLERTVKPKSDIAIPEIDVFGPGPMAGIARAISGQPLIPDESWLLITYLDKDLRISWGDGGLFVFAREGSPLLINPQIKGM